MYSPHHHPVLAAGLPASGLTLGAAVNSVAEFDKAESDSLSWRVVDDGVMGGLSKGDFGVSDGGVLTFRGTLSLENNGGFSSIRTEKVKMDLSGADGLLVRVKGDGRTYQMRFGTDARYQGHGDIVHGRVQNKQGRVDGGEDSFRSIQRELSRNEAEGRGF